TAVRGIAHSVTWLPNIETVSPDQNSTKPRCPATACVSPRSLVEGVTAIAALPVLVWSGVVWCGLVWSCRSASVSRSQPAHSAARPHSVSSLAWYSDAERSTISKCMLRNAPAVCHIFTRRWRWRWSGMNELDRILGILLTLQGRPAVTARLLAARFEVSTRTIYRDVRTMSGLGIPVYAERGRKGGIRLLPGYFLPPLMFAPAEAIALLLGLQL